MANILNLIAKFDTKEVKDGAKDLDGLKGKFQDLAKEIPGLGSAMAGADGVMSSFGSTMSSMTSLAIAAAGALGVLGVSMAFKYNDVIDGFGDMAEKFKMTATQAYFLSTAAKQAGGSLESLIAMGEKLNKAMSKSGDEAKGAGAAFARMGVESTGADGKLRNTAEVAGELIEKFESGSKTASDYADMTTLLGKGFEQQIPVFKAAAEANQVANDFQEKGIGITKLSLEVTGESEKAQLKLGAVFLSMGSILVEAVIPAFTSVTNWFVRSYTEGGFVAKAFGVIAVAAEVVTAVFKVLAAGVIVVTHAFSNGIDTIAMFGKMMWQVANGDYSKVGETFNAGVDKMRANSGGLKGDLKDLELIFEGSNTKKLLSGESIIARTKDQVSGGGKLNIFKGTAGGTANSTPEKAAKEDKVEDPNKDINRLIESLNRQKLSLENLNKEMMVTEELKNKKYAGASQELKTAALTAAADIDSANANKMLSASITDLEKGSKNYAASIQSEIKAKTMSARETKELNTITAIEIKYQEEINKLKAQGLWTQQRENQLIAAKKKVLEDVREATAEGVAADKDYVNNGIDAYVKGLGTMEEASAKLITNGLSKLEDGFVELFSTGKMDFQGFVKSIIDGLIRMMVQFTIMEPIMKAFKTSLSKMGGGGGGGGIMSLFSIFGNQGLVSAHATGTVSTGKTGLFGGSPVLIGESGDEAIMPLKRNAAGDLGVVSQGGSGATKQGDTNYSISVSIGSVDSAERQAELMKNIEQLITVKTKQTIADQSRKGNAFAR